MQEGRGYIEELRSTFRPASLPGGVAEKNSFSPGLEVGNNYPVYVHSGPGGATY